MRSSVALLLVSHDGERWLPTVIDGIRSQTVSPDQVVCVDTGSGDSSAELLSEAFGPVVSMPARTSYPVAVAEGLKRVGPDIDLIWLLHDDSTPDPAALEMLLVAAEEFGEADVFGPKLREWPSLRRLLEVGVTLSGTGRRETGLERGEYDQGQHDEIRTVMAVNTAGMLVRRSVLERLGGFEEQLPVFGNDIDFGWRAAAAGHTTMVVPPAVLFHAEAAHRGLRSTALTGTHTHYQERRAALFTLLANGRAALLPLRMLRLTLGTLVRMLGFVLVRDARAALDDLAALLSVLAHPGALRRARRRRRKVKQGSARSESLLAPFWVPYRHGLDFVGDVFNALTNQAADVAERRRTAAAERDPASFAARRQSQVQPVSADGEDEMPYDTGVVVRFLTNPVAVLLAVVTLLGIVGARAAFTHTVGGGLSPSPEHVGAWWSTYLASWHDLAGGTSAPAPPYLPVLAVLATILGGHPSAAVSAVLICAFPMALWGAWRLLRVLGRLVSHRGAPRWLILWGATTYALVPAVSGAWGDGRLAAVVAAAALPWLVHAALGFADPESERRARAGWRTGALLTLTCCFTPSAWVIAVVFALVVLVAASVVARPAVRSLRRDQWQPVVVALLTPVVALAAWWLPALVHGAGSTLLLDAGRLPAPAPDGLDLLLGRLPRYGAPAFLGVVLPVLAVLALIPRRTRIPVIGCWLAAAVVGLVAAVLAALRLHVAAGTLPAGLLATLVALQGCAIAAVVLGAQGALATRGAAAPLRWLQWGLAAIACLVTVIGLGWFVASGNERLGDHVADGVPAYMLETAPGGAAHRVLVLRGSVADGLSYTVVSGDGTRVGEDEIIAQADADPVLEADLRDFVTNPTGDVVSQLVAHDIGYVVLPPPADPSVSAAIDSAGGLIRASASSQDTRAWQVDQDLVGSAPTGQRSWLRIALLILQAVVVIAVAAGCLPTIERRRA